MDITLLKNLSSTKVYNDGQPIIHEGETMGNEMFIILRGTVDVYKYYGKTGEVKVAVLSAGDFFGEMSLFLNKERTATVIAVGQVVALVINRMNAYEFFEKQPQATYSLIKALCTRLEDTNNLYNNLKNEVLPSIVSESPPPLDIHEFSVLQELFPEGHKNYTVAVQNTDPELLLEKTYTCPVCEEAFKALTPKSKGLRLETLEKDFRPRYVDIDVTLFDILTCPECYYSAFVDSFEKPVLPKLRLKIDQITRFKPLLNLSFGADRDIAGALARFYLAIKCAFLMSLHPELTEARSWLRLYWLYQDTEDEEMMAYSAEQAKKSYIEVFEKTNVSEAQVQQLSLTIGELSYRLGDMATAKKFLYQAKIAKHRGQALTNQAEDRLNEIRVIEKATKEDV